MTTSEVLFVAVFLAVAAGGTAVALSRDPLRQSLNAGLFGLALVLLFYVLQAPDVALSMIVAMAVVLPLVELVAIAKTR
ncbi:MAG: hydrogenase subunit MbhD domain-containing protein [Candidatus Dormibacterales bacterium]